MKVPGPGRPLALLVAGAGLLSTAGCGTLDGIEPVTRQGGSINDLFALLSLLSLLVVLLVVALLAYALVRYRARPGHETEPEQVEGNRTLEIAWTATPALLVAILAVLMIFTMQTVDATEANTLRVRVIGHQWWWEYQYPDLGVTTANDLVVPAGTPLQLELTGADVIHSFWVPNFGRKLDAIPTRVTTMRFTVDRLGAYDGACTEFCGAQHAWMRIRATVVSPTDFNTWVQRQQGPAASPGGATVDRGKQLFLQHSCVNCHAIRGLPPPPGGLTTDATVGPDLTHVGSRPWLGAGVIDNTPTNLAQWVRDAPSIKPGVLMPAFPNFSDDDARALAAYLWGLK